MRLIFWETPREKHTAPINAEAPTRIPRKYQVYFVMAFTYCSIVKAPPIVKLHPSCSRNRWYEAKRAVLIDFSANCLWNLNIVVSWDILSIISNFDGHTHMLILVGSSIGRMILHCQNNGCLTDLLLDIFKYYFAWQGIGLYKHKWTKKALSKQVLVSKIIFLCKFYNFQFKQTPHRLFWNEFEILHVRDIILWLYNLRHNGNIYLYIY